MTNYLLGWIIICDYWWLFICLDDYLQLFVIIDVFGVRRCFFVIICNYLQLFVIICDYLWLFVIIYWYNSSFFCKKIFLLLLIGWISREATQNDKMKNSRFCNLRILRAYRITKQKFKVSIKNWFSLLKFYKIAVFRTV